LTLKRMAELLIAAHGVDGVLSEACERFLALQRGGDAAGGGMEYGGIL
jgi:hypothetical protein